MDRILTELKNMPIFKMSLGSKELFHSNFLEFLWEIENDMFFRIMNRLLPNGSQLNLQDGDKYILSREKENFDICIYHKDGRRIVYDFVLENKVKSMPRKGQLDDYKNKVKNSDCRFMLLSLVTEIPERDMIIEGEWTIVNYLELKNAIEKEIENRPQDKASRYIDDYCKFIGKMHELQKATLDDFHDSPLFQDFEDCKKNRLHDLYIKLRCDKFLVELKTLLEGKLKTLNVVLPITFISKYNEIKTGEQGIYLNTSINQGAGQAAVFIHLHDNKPVNNYEIVIQGNQYRHGINSRINSNKGAGQDKIAAQERILSESVNDNNDNGSFLNFQILSSTLYSEHDVLPQIPKKVKGQKRNEALNGYDTTCIYKHIDIIKGTLVKDLLPHMADDIIETIKTFKQ